MIQGFYITTKDCMGEQIAPNAWTGPIKKDTPVYLTYFDERGMEFSDGKNEFRLPKPCPVVPACSCQYCGKIIPSNKQITHLGFDENCNRIREMGITELDE